jgi:hypothetical protein
VVGGLAAQRRSPTSRLSEMTRGWDPGHREAPLGWRGDAYDAPNKA